MSYQPSDERLQEILHIFDEKEHIHVSGTGFSANGTLDDTEAVGGWLRLAKDAGGGMCETTFIRLSAIDKLVVHEKGTP